jgi:hypothetical protein
MSSSGLRKQHKRPLYCVVSSIQMKTYVLFLPTDIQLSIMLFSQARWRHMYCSFQQIFNSLLCCFIILYAVHMSSSGLRKQHNRQLNICWKEQYICLHLDWENNTIDKWNICWREQYIWQIFNCLLCCFLNPDEDICTVPSNRYSIVYCVVSSIQMKTYELFPPTMSSSGLRKQHNRQMKYLLEGTVHMSSSGLRKQHNRQMKYLLEGTVHMSSSGLRKLQQIFNCLLCCFLNPDEDICTVPSNRYFICLLCCFLNPEYVFIWIEETTQ